MVAAEIAAKKAKELAEQAKKVEREKRKLEQYREYLESDIKMGRDVGKNRISVEHQAKIVQREQEILDKLR